MGAKPTATAAFKPNPQTRFLAREMEALQEQMLQGFAEIRAAQSKLDMVEGICEKLEALDAKLSEQAKRLDQVQVKENLSCDTLGRVQQEQAHTAHLGKQQHVIGSGGGSSTTASEVSDGILGAVLRVQPRAQPRFPQVQVQIPSVDPHVQAVQEDPGGKRN